MLITPKSKVLKVIEAYPELESVLINYVPEFEKLKNPILRRTVAKFATLQQAAAIGKVNVEDLINSLRHEVGQDKIEIDNNQESNIDKPDWLNDSVVTQELDAREMLNQGEHPINRVMAEFNILKSRDIYKLTAPFLPAPLIEKVVSIGAEYWVEELGDSNVNVYFLKK